jgi:hypothetical protein
MKCRTLRARLALKMPAVTSGLRANSSLHMRLAPVAAFTSFA